MAIAGSLKRIHFETCVGRPGLDESHYKGGPARLDDTANGHVDP